MRILTLSFGPDWFSPGNNFSFNYCHATNKSWGQNGIYLDDVATGQTLIGNVYRGGGSPIKMNGGSYNTFDSLVVVEQGSLGFGNCRGLRGSPQEQYTCESSTGQRWLKILTGESSRVSAQSPDTHLTGVQHIAMHRGGLSRSAVARTVAFLHRVVQQHNRRQRVLVCTARCPTHIRMRRVEPWQRPLQLRGDRHDPQLHIWDSNGPRFP